MKKMKKREGSFFSSIISIFFILALLMSIVFVISKYRVGTEGQILHNDLTASNLAALGSKNLDLDLLAQYSNVVEIKDPNTALQTFEKHLKYNLGLDDNYIPSRNKFIKSKVVIKEFTIYNVNSITGEVIEYDLNTSTMTFKERNMGNVKGTIKTNSGNVINSTTIHSTITVELDTVFGSTQKADITEDNGILKK